MATDIITATNGEYTAVAYGKTSLNIYSSDGRIALHTEDRTANTPDELKKACDEIQRMEKAWAMQRKA